jgi:uncharacterized membrane protein
MSIRESIGGSWSLSAFIGCIALAVAAALALGGTRPDLQVFVGFSVVILGLAIPWAIRAARREPSVSSGFLVFALGMHLVGSMLRYLIIQSVYHGVSDANGYVAAGSSLAPIFRSFSLPPWPAIGTQSMNWLTGILFAFIGPTMLGGFVVCSTLSFIGAWFFYKAFCLAFPNGNKRLFALLIFLLPSIWYWPSSLGKDAIVMLFLGIATFGFANLFTGKVINGLLLGAAGLAGICMLRPPIAAALVLAAILGFALRPARERNPQSQVIVWILVLPLLGGLAFFTIKSSETYMSGQSVIEAYETQQSLDFSGGSGSNFQAPNIFSLYGPPVAILTSNFRPFPWEAGGMLPAIAGLEGLLVMALLLHRRREVFRALRSWRKNGMIVYVVGAFIGISLILSSLGNFGLLARQRTQVLPFLLMLPAIVKPVRRAGRRGSWVQAAPDAISAPPSPADSSAGSEAASTAAGPQARR